MCLQTRLTGKEKKEFLDELPDEITVWKVVTRLGKRYRTDCRRFSLHAGVVEFPQNIIVPDDDYYEPNYRGGGHFFLHYKGAKRWAYNVGDKIVRCKIKKEWINTVGKQSGHIVVVVKKAVFPKYIGGTK